MSLGAEGRLWHYSFADKVRGFLSRGFTYKNRTKSDGIGDGQVSFEDFSLLVVAACCLLYANLSYSQIPQTEREALIALY